MGAPGPAGRRVNGGWDFGFTAIGIGARTE